MKNTELSELAKQLGKKGGAKTKKKYGIEHYRELGRKGMASRWSKKTAKD